MQIAVLTFDGFNEIDSFVAAHILNRLRPQGWRAFITSPDAVITSANEVVVHAERPLEFAAEADAVIIGSGLKTSEIAENRELLGRIRLDPTGQLIGSQCSGALLLAKLGLLEGRPACTDLRTKKWVVEAGVAVIDQPFYAEGNVATAGGCLASQYLATWFMLRGASVADAEAALLRVAPVGQKQEYVMRAIEIVRPFLPNSAISSAASAAPRFESDHRDWIAPEGTYP
jgi:transcriptional regulator GlxA family with amidase domain